MASSAITSSSRAQAKRHGFALGPGLRALAQERAPAAHDVGEDRGRRRPPARPFSIDAMHPPGGIGHEEAVVLVARAGERMARREGLGPQDRKSTRLNSRP